MESIRSEAYSAVIADVLDALGRRNQVLSPAIRPLWPDAVLFGRARTLRVEDVDEVSANPYEVEFSLVDDLTPGDVVVAGCESHEAALWGELLTSAAQNRGAVGAVIDGFCRDVRKVQTMGFPLFARGMTPSDSNGRCEAVTRDEGVDCGSVSVSPGDFLFGDYDGVVVIPQELGEEVMRKALDKVRGERMVYRALRSGMSAREAWERWGIL